MPITPSSVVVITEAASGIGKALTEKYLALGARVAALDKNQDALQDLKSKTPGDNLAIYQVDVSHESEIQEVGSAIKKKWNQVTIWINNAGVGFSAPFHSMKSKDFETFMAINYYGVVYGTRMAMELMKESGKGVIVNVASLHGKVPGPFISSYAGSKHAVVGFTRSLQMEMELLQSPIKIILACPGWVRTPLFTSEHNMQVRSSFQWMIENPQNIAQQIIKAIDTNKKEISPGISGKLFSLLYGFSPWLMSKGIRLVFAKNWREILGISKIEF